MTSPDKIILVHLKLYLLINRRVILLKIQTSVKKNRVMTDFVRKMLGDKNVGVKNRLGIKKKVIDSDKIWSY